jgi:hypothetical protein
MQNYLKDNYNLMDYVKWPLVWPSGRTTDPEVRVRFPALPDFLRSSGSGKASTQPREYS